MAFSGAKRRNARKRKISFRTFYGSSATNRQTHSKFGNFFYLLVLIALGLFSMLPFFYSVLSSFKPLNELLVFPPKFWVYNPTFSNYLELPGLLSALRVPLSKYIFNSFYISILSTALYIFLATMAAFVLAKSNMKGMKIIFMLIQYALLFNGFTLAVPQYLIVAKSGIIDTYWAYILPSLASTMGVFLMKQYMEGSIPDVLLEAAEIDGAGPFRTFCQITVPMVKPCIMTMILFYFSSSWAAVPGNTIFSETIKTLPSVMSQISSGGIARQGSAMAVSVIMMIPPLVVYFISQSNVLESMNSAGIKE